jgi:hypothetical protein
MDTQLDRLTTYDKNHCWQYDIRLQREQEDREYIKNALNTNVEDIEIKDFIITPIITKDAKKEAVEFIKRYEWLGTITQYSTHYFGAYYKGILGGVTIFSMPNAFSKLLGDDTPTLERLVSRGACASWTPKGLASHFLMESIKQMVKTTQYRLFTAYSDPTAMELGTIYQSTNWYYLGQKSGTTTRYINPYTGKIVSDRFFRQKTAYKKFAQELGIEWQKEWTGKTGVNWVLIPNDIEQQLRDYSKKKQRESQSIEYPNKHKYAYVLGRSKLETKRLRKLLESNVKTYPYPKERGK